MLSVWKSLPVKQPSNLCRLFKLIICWLHFTLEVQHLLLYLNSSSTLNFHHFLPNLENLQSLLLSTEKKYKRQKRNAYRRDFFAILELFQLFHLYCSVAQLPIKLCPKIYLVGSILESVISLGIRDGSKSNVTYVLVWRIVTTRAQAHCPLSTHLTNRRKSYSKILLFSFSPVSGKLPSDSAPSFPPYDRKDHSTIFPLSSLMLGRKMPSFPSFLNVGKGERHPRIQICYCKNRAINR